MKTKKVNLRTILRVSETSTKFGRVYEGFDTRIAYVQGNNRNEAHFIHERSTTPRITIKRVPRWHRASIYN